MAKREMIVSGYATQDETQVDPFLRHLIGQFVDDLSKADKHLYDYCCTSGRPDLYWAIFDDKTFALYAPDGDGKGTSVTFGYEPKSKAQWTRLRQALNYALELSMTIDQSPPGMPQ